MSYPKHVPWAGPPTDETATATETPRHATFNALQTILLATRDGREATGGDMRPNTLACNGRSIHTYHDAGKPVVRFFDNHARWFLDEQDHARPNPRAYPPVSDGQEGTIAFQEVTCQTCRVMLDTALEGREWRKCNPKAYPEVSSDPFHVSTKPAAHQE